MYSFSPPPLAIQGALEHIGCPHGLPLASIMAVGKPIASKVHQPAASWQGYHLSSPCVLEQAPTSAIRPAEDLPIVGLLSGPRLVALLGHRCYRVGWDMYKYCAHTMV